MIKRLFDLSFAIPLFVLTSPLWVLAALAVRLSSPGPVLYRAQRTGRGGVPFVIYKFRTMHVLDGASGSPITGVADRRVFRMGHLLRCSKIDELPQLINVIRGEMSICGPRPEAVEIVQRFYQPWQVATLSVRPGLASPGSLFNYTHGDDYLQSADAQEAYVDRLLPIKLALELVYLQRVSVAYDLEIMMRTIFTIGRKAVGQRHFALPREFASAKALLAAQAVASSSTAA